MLRLPILAISLAVAFASISDSAVAQDCDRYAWACEGWTGPQNPMGPTSVPSPVVPVPEAVGRGLTLRSSEATLLQNSGLQYQYARLYAQVNDEAFPIPAVQLSDIDPAFLRTLVYYPSNEPAGTIIIDSRNRHLYLVQGNGRALRYGVGVGRDGFSWSGVAIVGDKQEWPDWYPPAEMVQRQPELKRQLTELQSGRGVPGGPRNPLGARAMYLWQGNKDTLYRIHGTTEPWTIGRSVSSGCVRMINQDVIDLYERTSVGAKVIVLSSR